MNRSDIKKFSVKINYDLQGTGVLAKIDSQKAYVLTATHNFKKEKNESYFDVVIEDIVIEKINIETNKKEKLSVESLVYAYNELTILLVHGNFNDFDIIEVLKGKFTDNLEYFFSGYPSSKAGNHLINNLTSVDEKDNFQFSLYNQQKERKKYLEGLSGSGVFTEKNGRYLLCGVVLKSEDPYDNIENFNVSAHINEVNHRLSSQKLPTIPIKNTYFHLQHLDEMYIYLLENSENFLEKKMKNNFGMTHEYKNLISDSEKLTEISKLKKLNKDMASTLEFGKFENELSEQIANMYLLASFISLKYQKKEEALEYFKKARQYKPEYVVFLADMDKEASKEELFREAKEAYFKDDFKYSYECLIKLLSLYLTKEEEIEVYEYLVEISKKVNNLEDLKYCYEQLLNLYDHNSKKAEVYYQLSLRETKSESENYINEGLDLVRLSKLESDIELTYLLYKRLYELTEDGDVYLSLVSSLEDLAQIKEEYKYQLSTLFYSQTLDTIGWVSYISIFMLVLLGSSVGNFFFLSSSSFLLTSIMVFMTGIVIFFKVRMINNIKVINKAIIFFSGITSLLQIIMIYY